jgi:uncharacterized integral membrane protein
MSMDWKENERRAAGQELPEEKAKISPRLIGIIVVVALILLFVLQNTKKTEIHFLFFDLRAGTWFAILVAIALGVLLDRAFTWWWHRRKAAKET